MRKGVDFRLSGQKPVYAVSETYFVRNVSDELSTNDTADHKDGAWVATR
jgi:hypothetical protein